AALGPRGSRGTPAGANARRGTGRRAHLHILRAPERRRLAYALRALLERGAAGRPAGGAAVLLAAFSKRVHDWIRSVSHLGEVRSAPDLGRAAANFLEERLPKPSRIGVLELDALPWPVAEPIMKSEYGGAVVDATELFAAIRQPADEAEIRLARRAAT